MFDSTTCSTPTTTPSSGIAPARSGFTDAEDAAADVFAVAWRRIEDMPEGDAKKAWLFGVAHRVVGSQ